MKQIDEKKKEKYNPDDLFKTSKSKENVIKQNINMPIVVKKMGFFEKMFNYIRNFFVRGQ